MFIIMSVTHLMYLILFAFDMMAGWLDGWLLQLNKDAEDNFSLEFSELSSLQVMDAWMQLHHDSSISRFITD